MTTPKCAQCGNDLAYDRHARWTCVNSKCELFARIHEPVFDHGDRIAVDSSGPYPDIPFCCPICGEKVSIEEISGAFDDGDVDEMHLACSTEPDDNDSEYEHENFIRSHFSMPYSDWMPLEERAKSWFNKRYWVR